ncbi:zwei Ig domain protein zig-8-like isoform X2 [Oratosquilla oratoria]|uniref:zwei Ig domain protein zig-8-like isoform X2 n=1 Tax=Oratosquilla oratoria TaxID=337810 RepID=UPI003F7595F8
MRCSLALWCGLVFLSCGRVDGGTEAEILEAIEETQKQVAWKYIPLSGPHLDEEHSTNVTSQVGKTAVLNCRIKYLGAKTVSWMRSRDLHLLTVGRFTYTSDERFKAVHQHGSDDWLLKIHYVQERDAGAYECQVSTTPPMSHIVYLSVVEPVTTVIGGPDLYINSGSTINLTCVVKFSPDPPPYIFWYHENELLSYDSPRGGITVVTEHGPVSTSRLLIQKANKSDAGLYTCRPANADPHHITVHIISNENKAAIQHKNGTSTSSSSSSSSTSTSSTSTSSTSGATSLFTHANNVAGWLEQHLCPPRWLKTTPSKPPRKPLVTMSSGEPRGWSVAERCILNVFRSSAVMHIVMLATSCSSSTVVIPLSIAFVSWKLSC